MSAVLVIVAGQVLRTEGVGIIARDACGFDEEGVCAIRIISKRTGKNSKVSVW